MWGILLSAPVAMSPAERLQTAEAAAAALEYGTAIEELQILLADPDATDDQKEQAHLIAGTSSGSPATTSRPGCTSPAR